MPSTPRAVVVKRLPLRSNFQAIALALSPSAMKRKPPSLFPWYPVVTRESPSRMTPLRRCEFLEEQMKCPPDRAVS